MVTIKDTVKLFGISIVICCAAFVCTLFLNYRVDLIDIKDTIVGEQSQKIYDAQLSTSTVVCGVCGGCLIITSVIMLLTYIRNFIDSRSKELGVMKALGYSNFGIAKHFWVFGLSVFAGAVVGVGAAAAYMPTFYDVQGKDNYYDITRHSQYGVWAALILVPTVLFMVLSVFFALCRLKKPVMKLLREDTASKVRVSRKQHAPLPFLKELKKDTVKSKRSLIFFIWFSAFCFACNTQMAFSMKDLASETMGWMILIIGLILAYMMLFLALSSVVKGNAKTAAMMRIFGYGENEISRSILNGYRPIALIGFVLGTGYQFGLLKIMVNVVFKDVENVKSYNFDFKALCIALPVFIISYELIMYFFSTRIRKLTIKSVMLEG